MGRPQSRGFRLKAAAKAFCPQADSPNSCFGWRADVLICGESGHVGAKAAPALKSTRTSGPRTPRRMATPLRGSEATAQERCRHLPKTLSTGTFGE